MTKLQNCVPLLDVYLYLPIHANKNIAKVRFAERSGTGYSSMKLKKYLILETKYSLPLASFSKRPVESISGEFGTLCGWPPQPHPGF